jgi:DNA-binding NarL/FixJ family response regulator
MVQVYLFSPSPAVRLGLRALLEQAAGVQVSGEAASLEEANGARVDVLVYAPVYGSTVGIKLPETLIEGGIALLVLSEEIEAARAYAGLPLRAWGMLSPSASAEELAAAILAVNEGLVLLDAPAARKLISFSTAVDVEQDMLEALTERETEVLQLLAQGMTNKQIAARLVVSTHTVKFHIASIYGKLGAANRTEAVRVGLQKGLVML